MTGHEERDRESLWDSTSLDEYTGSTIGLAHLATFPVQNPNAVIETDLAGAITYLNPEAAARFPDLEERGVDHPLLAGLLEAVASLRRDRVDSVQREVQVGEDVFDQKVCYLSLDRLELIRVYVHDVTAHRRAEAALGDLARRVVEAQEDERKRVSRELHDEAGQAMAALRISLQLIRDEPDIDRESLVWNLDSAIELVDTTQEQIRLLAQDLRPPALDTLGLSDTLDDFCSRFASRTRLDISYLGSEVGELRGAQEICLYRVLQEALANVAMHADATEACVSLERDGEALRLMVRDNGRGIKPARFRNASRAGVGLVGMRERLEMLGGQLDINSDAGGTHLIATLPVREP
jgi:signal transduction histidine kinase